MQVSSSKSFHLRRCVREYLSYWVALSMFIEERVGDSRGGFSYENFFGWDENGSIKVSKETLPTEKN